MEDQYIHLHCVHKSKVKLNFYTRMNSASVKKKKKARDNNTDLAGHQEVFLIT